MTKRRIATEPRKFWTADEDAVLRARFPHESTKAVAAALGRSYGAVHQRANALGVYKSAVYLASPAACRLRRGDNVGAAYRFKKGQPAFNKGLKRGKGWAPGRMAEGQFKKGAMAGRAQKLWKPVGSERISKDGYLERKIHDTDFGDLPSNEANRLRQRRWRAVHLVVWEEAHGPLPKGYAVCFKDGNKRNIALDNLEMVKRSDLMRRNTIHNLPPELKQTVQLLGRVNRQIRKRERHAEEQDRRSA